MAVTANKIATHEWAVSEFSLDIKFLDGSKVPKQLLTSSVAKNYGLTVAGTYTNSQCVKQSDLSKPDSGGGGGDTPTDGYSYKLSVESKLTGKMSCRIETDYSEVTTTETFAAGGETKEIPFMVKSQAHGDIETSGNLPAGDRINIWLKDDSGGIVPFTYTWSPSSGTDEILDQEANDGLQLYLNADIAASDTGLKGTLDIRPSDTVSIVISVTHVPSAEVG